MRARHLRLAMALCAGAACSSVEAQSLSTLYAGGNGGATLWTLYFDVTANAPLNISSFDLNISSAVGTAFTIDVYRTAAGGTWSTNTTNAGAWTQVSTGSGSSAGTGQHTPVDTADFILPAGTYGFAIRYTGVSMAYTDGTGANQTYSNADMTISCGASQVSTAGPFTGALNNPRVWNGTIYYGPGDPNLTGACCFADGTCQFETVAACAAASGNFAGVNVACASANCPQPGGCCASDGTCSLLQPGACSASGGAFAGAGVSCAAANCPQPGACCKFDGTCTFVLQTACVTSGGSFRGPGQQCATAGCPAPFFEGATDAGDSLATAAVPSGSGSLTGIQGTINAGNDADLYRIQICDPANFGATTTGYTAADALGDTQLFLFDANGMGVQHNDDEPNGTTNRSTMGHQFVTAAGTYYLAISGYNHDPVSAGGLIWQNTDPATGTYRTVHAPDGPGAASPLSGWDTGTSAVGSYGISLSGTCYNSTGPTCYANCDQSTAVPFLNVQDFTCFLQKFASADAYANCDASTTAPTLNVQDFTCFLQKFAAGCSAP